MMCASRPPTPRKKPTIRKTPLAANCERPGRQHDRSRNGAGIRQTTAHPWLKLENMETNQLDWSQEFSGMSGDLMTLEDQIYASPGERAESENHAGGMSVAGRPPD